MALPISVFSGKGIRSVVIGVVICVAMLMRQQKIAEKLAARI